MLGPIVADPRPFRTACSKKRLRAGRLVNVDSSETGPPIGRPREFNREAVVTAIVDLFWEQGFSATSMTDIIDRTGLSKSSLYGAFGSKDDLFRTALDHYLADHDEMVATMLTDGSRGLDDIDAFLDHVEHQAGLGEHRGCLAVNTATELRTVEPALCEIGARHRETLRLGFATALERAAALGEIDADRVPDLANVLLTTAIGIAVMTSGGAPADEIGAQVASAKNTLRRG